MTFSTKLRRIGTSMGVIVPSLIIKTLGFQRDEELEMEVTNSSIIIRKKVKNDKGRKS